MIDTRFSWKLEFFLSLQIFSFISDLNQIIMSKKIKSKEDFINEPKVVALPGQTYSYGQTPAALCRFD